MRSITRALKHFKDTFSLDLKEDIGVYYYNFILTYAFVLFTCLVMCDGISESIEVADPAYPLEVLRTVFDTMIPSTIAFACSIFLQNLALTSRVGATKYPWNLALIFVSFMYWSLYLHLREIKTKKIGALFFVVSLLIIFLCTASTIQTYDIQHNAESNSQPPSLSAD